MADLNVVLMFCVLYSGVVGSALWITVARRPQAVQLPREKKSFSNF